MTTPSPSFLEKIKKLTLERVAEAKEKFPVDSLFERLNDNPDPIDFLSRLTSASSPRIIAEIKKRSPSKGDIAGDIDPLPIAVSYAESGAAALSILTEPQYFGGSLDDLERIRKKLPDTPLLRKDFILDSYQLVESRAFGADAVLLIHALLGHSRLRKLHDQALELGLTPLVEVHKEEEFEGAVLLGARLIGVNNRDLRTLKIDLGTSRRLARLKPVSSVMIAESGIEDSKAISEFEALGYDAFLIGTHLMKNTDPGLALRELIQGVP